MLWPRLLNIRYGWKRMLLDASLPWLQHRLLETRVTRSAKRLRQVERVQATGVEDLKRIESLRPGGDEVLLAWTMTRLTTNPGTQLIELQLHALNRTRRMTPETLLRLVRPPIGEDVTTLRVPKDANQHADHANAGDLI